MSTLFPLPQPSPLERLSVQDGLLLNAERWQCAHKYHSHRQNFHYQSLNQPGIVCGLGVSIIPAPANISAQYRDGRWIKIQSGIAIDLLGNPIVVPHPMDFRIASQAQQPLTVYIVISYVDPDKLQYQESQFIVKETFRIDEKTTPPTELEVEICRILLHSSTVQLEPAANVFFPSDNNLDLRYRQQAMARPQGIVRVAHITENLPSDDIISSNLNYLLQSTATIYPALTGAELGKLPLEADTSKQLTDYDLLYVSYKKLLSLTDLECEILQEYSETGGVVLVELESEKTDISELANLRQKLKAAIIEHSQDIELSKLQQELKSELESTEIALEQKINQVSLNIKNQAQKIANIAEETGHIFKQHPLRNQPFLFGQFPTVHHPIQLLNWGCIVMVIGNLSSAWGLDEELSLSRETIRNAQEMGINILYFAWRRRQLIQLQQEINF